MQRAASLGMTSAARTRIYEVVKKAYNIRSRYVHGDEIENKSIELPLLRKVSLMVFLRWLVVETSLSEEDQRRGSLVLEETFLSDVQREKIIQNPLMEFYKTTPPKILPRDFVNLKSEGMKDEDR